MAKLFGGGKKLNAEGKKDMDQFEVIPNKTWVELQIVKSKREQNGKKNGYTTSLELDVCAGTYKGRKVFVNLNLENPSEEAMERAERELATIMRACGKAAIEDTEELHMIPMKAQLGVVPEKDGYPAKNKVLIYKRMDDLGDPATLGKGAGDKAGGNNGGKAGVAGEKRKPTISF